MAAAPCHPDLTLQEVVEAAGLPPAQPPRPETGPWAPGQPEPVHQPTETSVPRFLPRTRGHLFSASGKCTYN